MYSVFFFPVSPNQIGGVEQETCERDHARETGHRLQRGEQRAAENERRVQSQKTRETKESKRELGEKETVQRDACN